MVEAIPKTNEVIAAGRLEGDATLLVHSKLMVQRGAVDCIIKCNDNNLAQSFAVYLKKSLAP